MISTKSVSVNIKKRFSDFDLSFRPNPVTGDLIMRYDADAIKKSVKHLVLTHYYQRPFQPRLGSPVSRLQFDLIDLTTEADLRNAIYEVISNYEPRAIVKSILVDFRNDQNGVDISIFFDVQNLGRASVNVFLKRTR